MLPANLADCFLSVGFGSQFTGVQPAFDEKGSPASRCRPGDIVLDRIADHQHPRRVNPAQLPLKALENGWIWLAIVENLATGLRIAFGQGSR